MAIPILDVSSWAISNFGYRQCSCDKAGKYYRRHSESAWDTQDIHFDTKDIKIHVSK